MDDLFAPDVGRKDQLCGFLKADIAGNHAGGRSCATGSDVCAGRSEGRDAGPEADIRLM
jgi:hypothetical protein